MQSPGGISGFGRWSGIAAGLFALAGLCGSPAALAADARGRAVAQVHHGRSQRTEPPSPRRVVIERRTLPQVALGGTVVLRGSRSVIANVGQPNPASNGVGYGSSAAPVPAPAPGAGGISGLDASGIDRGGLSPENAP